MSINERKFKRMMGKFIRRLEELHLGEVWTTTVPKAVRGNFYHGKIAMIALSKRGPKTNQRTIQCCFFNPPVPTRNVQARKIVVAPALSRV